MSSDKCISASPARIGRGWRVVALIAMVLIGLVFCLEYLGDSRGARSPGSTGDRAPIPQVSIGSEPSRQDQPHVEASAPEQSSKENRILMFQTSSNKLPDSLGGNAGFSAELQVAKPGLDSFESLRLSFAMLNDGTSFRCSVRRAHIENLECRLLIPGCFPIGFRLVPGGDDTTMKYRLLPAPSRERESRNNDFVGLPKDECLNFQDLRLLELQNEQFGLDLPDLRRFATPIFVEDEIGQRIHARGAIAASTFVSGGEFAGNLIDKSSWCPVYTTNPIGIPVEGAIAHLPAGGTLSLTLSASFDTDVNPQVFRWEKGTGWGDVILRVGSSPYVFRALDPSGNLITPLSYKILDFQGNVIAGADAQIGVDEHQLSRLPDGSAKVVVEAQGYQPTETPVFRAEKLYEVELLPYEHTFTFDVDGIPADLNGVLYLTAQPPEMGPSQARQTTKKISSSDLPLQVPYDPNSSHIISAKFPGIVLQPRSIQVSGVFEAAIFQADEPRSVMIDVFGEDSKLIDSASKLLKGGDLLVTAIPGHAAAAALYQASMTTLRSDGIQVCATNTPGRIMAILVPGQYKLTVYIQSTGQLATVDVDLRVESQTTSVTLRSPDALQRWKVVNESGEPDASLRIVAGDVPPQFLRSLGADPLGTILLEMGALPFQDPLPGHVKQTRSQWIGSMSIKWWKFYLKDAGGVVAFPLTTENLDRVNLGEALYLPPSLSTSLWAYNCLNFRRLCVDVDAQSNTLTIRDDRSTGSLRVRIVNSDGERFEMGSRKVLVRLRMQEEGDGKVAWSSQNPQFTVAEDGTLELPALKPGTYTLRASDGVQEGPWRWVTVVTGGFAELELPF